MEKALKIVLLLVTFLKTITCKDITPRVFGGRTDGMPAAFGDFNSDELTDVFIVTDDGRSVEILLAHEEEPLLRSANPKLKCTFTDHIITSVVPGDFDGDALMDVLVTTKYKPVDNKNNEKRHLNFVYILWAESDRLNCSNEQQPILEMTGEPLAIDYDQDMIIDLFGEDRHGNRVFWVFENGRAAPSVVPMKENRKGQKLAKLSIPHSHAFLDMNRDNMADLFVTTEENFEVWLGNVKNSTEKFILDHVIEHPSNLGKPVRVIGQSTFMDVDLEGEMNLITPVCFDQDCHESRLMAYADNKWYDLQVNFRDNDSVWGFEFKPGQRYTDVITLHSGDFNLDGYPDILATLKQVPKDGGDNNKNLPQSFLLENVACTTSCGKFKRSFNVMWTRLTPFVNGTAVATFFDFYQDGILDIILVTFNGVEYKAAAFKNSLDYDANFLKIMVITGLTNKNNPTTMGRVGKKKRRYGTNLPGPRISYRTTTQAGDIRHGESAQLSQSAHFSLNLPYTIFGLGRTPNFVDGLQVGLSNHTKEWLQIIPNSQMVVIPWPPNKPYSWTAQLFVTPSKLILMSVAALTGICGVITIIIGALHWKERQEDKKERLSETHRFHFDAM